MLKQIWGLALLVITLSIFASDSSRRFEVAGPFIYCDNGHFFHKACFNTVCSKCNSTIFGEVDSAYFLKNSRCFICKQYYVKRDREEVMPLAEIVTLYQTDLASYNEHYRRLLTDAGDLKDLTQRREALAIIKALNRSRFRY